MLPSAIRKKMKLKEGARLQIRLEHDQIVLIPRECALRRAQELFCRAASQPGRRWSDELIEERRKEARRELAG